MKRSHDDELVDALLDEAVEHRGEGVDAEERARLAAFLDRSRDALEDAPEWPGLREGALVGRVLHATTREDLSWRGELRLVGAFVRERLAGSVLLRVVAASLLLHVIALPVVAYMVFHERAQERRIEIRIEPREVDQPFEEAEEARELVEVEPPSLLDPLHPGPDPTALENARRRARFVLSTARGPVIPLSTGASVERRLLSARSRVLDERARGDRLDEPADTWHPDTLLARTLWAEILLDRLVLTGQRPPRLAEALGAIQVLVLPRGEETSDALQRLAVGALERAQAMGAWEASAPSFEPESVPLPLGPTWFETLRRAAEGSSLEASPELEAFAGWVRR